MTHRALLFGVLLLSFGLASCTPVQEKRSDAKMAEYHYTMGLSSLNEGRSTEALKEFLEAEKYDDRDPKIQERLAWAYVLKKAYAEAEVHFDRAIELSAGDPKYYSNKGALYLTMGRYDDAIGAFRIAADNLLFDRPEVAWSGIGVANVQKQDYMAAEIAFRKAIELNPRYLEAPYRLGELYYNLDRPAEALEMFTRCVELAHEFTRGYYWQGLAYMKLKELEKARAAFQQVLRLDSGGEFKPLAEKYLNIIDK